MEVNGVSLSDVKTEDMKGIEVYVTNTSPIPVSFEGMESILSNLKPFDTGTSQGPAPKINLNPKAEDLIGLGNNLAAIIPTGFLLLHNDLVKYLGAEDGGSSIPTMSAGKAAGIGSMVGGFVGGALGGLFTGLMGDATTNHMNDIIDELNQDLTADDFRGNEEVKQAQVEGFIAYLKAYYTQQRNALLIEGTGSSVGTAIAGAVTSFLSGTIGKLFNKEDNETPNKLGEIAEELTTGLDKTPFLPGGELYDDVKEVQNKAVMNYLKAYYAMQISEMTAQGAGNTVGNFLGGALSGILTGLFEGTIGNLLDRFELNKTAQDEYAASLESIVVELQNYINIDDYVDDPDILSVQREAISNYLQAYYAIQIQSLIDNNTDGFFTSLAKDLGSAPIAFLTSLLGIGEGSSLNNSLMDAIEQIASQPIDVSNIIGNNELNQAQKDSILELYNNLLAKSAAALVDEFNAGAYGDRKKWWDITVISDEIKTKVSVPINNTVLDTIEKLATTTLSNSQISQLQSQARLIMEETIKEGYGGFVSNSVNKILEQFSYNYNDIYSKDFQDRIDNSVANLNSNVLDQINKMVESNEGIDLNVKSINMDESESFSVNSSYDDSNLVNKLDSLEATLITMVELLSAINQNSLNPSIVVNGGNEADDFGVF